MELLRTFSEETLENGLIVVVWDFNKRESRPISLRIIEEPDRRRRIEMSPVFIWTEFGNLERILERAGQIIADPDNVNPQHPVGHFWGIPTRPTSRWGDTQTENLLRGLGSLGDSAWKKFRDDGGSDYFMLKDGSPGFVRQVTRSGRIMLGEVQDSRLPVEWGSKDVDIRWKTLRRLVIQAGSDDEKKGLSEVGQTNYDFGGFES